MTNFDRWQLYNREVSSPQNFVDFAWYYLIAAFLQRRVYRGPDHRKLFPCQYPILVGEPGIGKGLIIKQVLEFLKEHKLSAINGAQKVNGTTAAGTSIQEAEGVIKSVNFATATTGREKVREEPLLIPVAANATTYEALTGACARATRACMFSYFDAKIGKKRDDIYRHASLCFCLEELSSLLHKESKKVVDFLITGYDCGDYVYDTKTQGTDYLKDICINFFGGTTPGFVESAFSDKLLAEGFASRVWFIYATKNRFYDLWSPELTEEQREAKKVISAHLKKLTNIYGEVKFSDEAIEWLRVWWKNINENPAYKRPNTSDKLNPYYSRKDIHAQKLAIAMHFGEDADVNEYGAPLREIPLSTVQFAVARLDKEEPTMHHALQFDGANPLHKTGKKVLRFLKKHGPKTSDELVMEFWADGDREATHAIINHLTMAGQIALDPKLNVWFSVPEKES